MVTGFIPLVNADLDGGGLIENAGPTVASIITHSSNTDGGETTYKQLEGSPASCYNDDGDDYLIVRVCVNDTNGEDDLLWINITCNQDPTGDDAWMNHAITASDRSNTTPVSAELMEIHGWDNGSEDNGFLTFTFKYIYVNDDSPANGAAARTSWQWTATVYDTEKNSDNANLGSHYVYNYADMTAPQSYYDSADSVNSSDTAWGNWTASAGDQDVHSKNYLKATNGGTANGNVSISFSDSTLDNASTAATISLANMVFQSGEAASAGAVGEWANGGTADSAQAFTVTHGESSTVERWFRQEIDIPSLTVPGYYNESFTFTITGVA